MRASYCHDRFCKPCARAKALTIAANLKAHIVDRQVRLVTLTLKSCPDPLAKQLTRLYQCFARLRRAKWWKMRVLGGAAFFEVTRSAETGLWHPHLHILVEGKYLPQEQLAGLWKDITGDSKIVDIRLVDQRKGVAEYVTKYVGSPFPADIYRDQDLLAEAMTAITGRRTCLTFGHWRGLKLTKLPTDDSWEPLAPLQEIRQRAQTGDPWAIAVLQACKPNLQIGTDQAYAWAYEESETQELEGTEWPPKPPD